MKPMKLLTALLVPLALVFAFLFTSFQVDTSRGRTVAIETTRDVTHSVARLPALPTSMKLLTAGLSQKAFAQDAPTPVPTEPTTIGEAAAWLPALITFAKNSQWLLFGAVMALVGVFLIRQYVLPGLGLNTKILPLVSAVLGILAGVGGAVYAGSDLMAAAMAVLSGPLASALWSAVVKYFLPEAPVAVKA